MNRGPGTSVDGSPKMASAMPRTARNHTELFPLRRASVASAAGAPFVPGNYMDQATLRRFNAKVDKASGGCWEWLGAKHEKGYGRFWCRKRHQPSHRVSFKHFVGLIPPRFVVDHICGNPGCVNPQHLRAITNAENVLTGKGPTAANARKTHCIHGHPFGGDNLYVTSDGQRKCRQCCRKRDAHRREAKCLLLACRHGAVGSNPHPAKQSPSRLLNLTASGTIFPTSAQWLEPTNE